MADDIKSLLTDEEIEDVAHEMRMELSEGQRLHLEDVAARFGISVDDAIKLAEEFASEQHGRPMRFIRPN